MIFYFQISEAVGRRPHPFECAKVDNVRGRTNVLSGPMIRLSWRLAGPPPLSLRLSFGALTIQHSSRDPLSDSLDALLL